MGTRLDRRRFLRGLAVTAAGGLLVGHAAPSRAHGDDDCGLPEPDWEPSGPAWERLGPDVRIERLFAPASGALFARTAGGLLRSDDAGATWREVGMPPAATGTARAVLVHPLDHRILYATGADGLYRSTDDAQTWSVVLPGSRRAIRLAVSPADPDLVYAALVTQPTDFWLAHSRDGGATWQELDEQHNSLCGWSVPILQPHPGDPSRLFRTAGCYAGRDLGDELEQSVDGGATFARVFRPQLAYPSTLVGGTGESPARWYLAANRDFRAGGSSVFTSADDGVTWTEVLQFRGGGTPEQGMPNVRVGGLAYDPAASGQVFVALNRSLGPGWETMSQGSGLTTSSDAGETWTELGRQDLPPIHDLALGIDGAWLFAATLDGVWRIEL